MHPRQSPALLSRLEAVEIVLADGRPVRVAAGTQHLLGPNLERLQRIKAQYDPRNLFPGLLNIAPKG